MVYLDNAATSPVRPEVIKIITEQLSDNFGNPSSGYRLGKDAKQSLRQARQRLAGLLHLKEDQIYFTSGATEANNWAIRSQAIQSKKLGRGNHMVVTAIEHSAVLKTLETLKEEGFEFSQVYPDDEGYFHVEDFVEASNPQTMGWLAMTVNNELGTVLPIQAIGEKAKELGYWFHTDSVQAMGKIDLDFGNLPVTSFVASGHKFNAPKGIGFLAYQPFSQDMYLKPMIVGGGQENAMRSGTENIPYIIGMVEAIRLAFQELEAQSAYYLELSTYLYRQLDKHGIDYQANGPIDAKVGHIHNIWFKGFTASQLMILLDLEGIYISAGSACSAGSITPSRVLQAYFPNQENRWRESVRISFGPQNTKDDIDQLVEVIAKEVERRKKNGI